MLDRIDIVVEVPAVHFEDLRTRAESEPSCEVKIRVDTARKQQHKRFGNRGQMCNARMGPDEMRKYCQLDDVSADLMKQDFCKVYSGFVSSNLHFLCLYGIQFFARDRFRLAEASREKYHFTRESLTGKF
jgi:predicted ATPase with chaperone activity